MMIQQGRKEREEKEEGEREEQTGPTTPQPGCFFRLLGFLQQPSHSQLASQPVHSSSHHPPSWCSSRSSISIFSTFSNLLQWNPQHPQYQIYQAQDIYTKHKGQIHKHKTLSSSAPPSLDFFFPSSPHPFCVLQQRVISINFSSSKDRISSTICNCFSSKRCKSQLLVAFSFLQKDASLSYQLHFAFLQKDANFIYYLQLLLCLFTHLCASSHIYQLLFSKRCKPSLLFAILFFFFFTHLCASSNIHQLLFFKMCKPHLIFLQFSSSSSSSFSSPICLYQLIFINCSSSKDANCIYYSKFSSPPNLVEKTSSICLHL